MTLSYNRLSRRKTAVLLYEENEKPRKNSLNPNNLYKKMPVEVLSDRHFHLCKKFFVIFL